MTAPELSLLSDLRDRAWRALQGGEYGLALDLFRQLRLHDPGDDGVIVALARCLRRMGRGHEATGLLELQLRQSPESLPLQLAQLEGDAEAAHWQQLLASLAPLLVATPDDAGVLALLHQAAARLLPADAWSRELPAETLLNRLQYWLPQRWLLTAVLPMAPPRPWPRSWSRPAASSPLPPRPQIRAWPDNPGNGPCPIWPPAWQQRSVPPRPTCWPWCPTLRASPPFTSGRRWPSNGA
ncbi:MAG: tetratricopeptide repeat protein [Cyanobacteriota bacterium]